MQLRSSDTRNGIRGPLSFLFIFAAALLLAAALIPQAAGAAGAKRISFQAPRGGALVSGNAAIRLSLPTSAVRNLRFKLDGAAVRLSGSGSGRNIRRTLDTTKLSDDVHSLTVSGSYRSRGRTVTASGATTLRVANIPATNSAARTTADTKPPTAPTNLKVASITQTGASLSWSASTDNVGVASYDVNVNGKWFGWSLTTSYMMSGLTCGTTYRVYIVAIDAARNYTAGSAVSFTTAACTTAPPPVTDTTAPSAPTGLTAGGISQTGATLNWNASTDNVGVARYDVYKSGAKVATTSATSAAVTLTCGITSSFQVAAVDAAGNSATSAPISVTGAACGDTTPPTTPTGLAFSNITQTSATMTWNASTDNVAFGSYDINVNGAWFDWSMTNSYTAANLTCGTTYVVYIIAIDAARNYAAGQPQNLTTAACGTGSTGSTGSTDSTGSTGSTGSTSSTGSTGSTGSTTSTGTPGSPSGIGVPSGNTTGWKLIFADDFTKDAALGTMGSDTDAGKIIYTGTTGTKWVTYPKTYTDTYEHRPYRSDQVLSVHDGTMDFYLHNVDGQPAGANPSPVITGTSQYQTFGRYSARIKVDNTDLSEYYMAWLLWPYNESEWGSAESDYPEGQLLPGKQGISGYPHYNNGKVEGFHYADFDFHAWHTITQDWTPLVRRYYVDDKLIYTTLNPVYQSPERWQLQTETNTWNVANPTHVGHLLVDWVAVYSYSPTTP